MYSSFYTRKTQIGTRGHDVLVGQGRGGEIYGGRGDDLLIAGGRGGSDVLHGGPGADTFSLKPSASGAAPLRHHLLDFNPGEGDVIDLSSLVGRGGDFSFLGEKPFTGGGGVEVRFSRKLISSRSPRRREIRSAGSFRYQGFTEQVEFALKQALGDIPDVPFRQSRRRPFQFQIDMNADQTADYIFEFEGSSVSSFGKHMRGAVKGSSSSFLKTALPSKKAEKSCFSITQYGIPIPGLDSYLTFSPTFNLSISSSTQQPTISCPFSATGFFGATLPLGVDIGGKLGIVTGSLAGTTKLPKVQCALAEYELPTEPPLTASVSALLAVGAELTVDDEGLNKQIGVSLGINVGATQTVAQSNSGFQDSLFNVYATQYSNPPAYDGKGIDLSITMNPPETGNLAAEVGLGLSIPGTEICKADIISGVVNFGFPLELKFKDLSDPKLTLGAEIGVDADILKVSCGPYSLVAEQFPIASFNVLEALTGEDSIVIVGENGVFSN